MSISLQTLLPKPPAELVDGLAALEPMLARVFPMRKRHRAALPSGIEQLSEYLTLDRESLPRDYMARPEFLSAYLHWFLPWNIYRQGRLLAGLQLDLPAEARIVDVGSGPLTFLQALWLGRPELRDRRLNYMAIDRAEPALKTGRALFNELAGDAAQDWTVRTDRQIAGARQMGKADLLVAANFLNEIDTTGTRSRRQRGPAPDLDLDTPADRLLENWEKVVGANGAILLIEPGMRSAARQLVRIRDAAQRRGWTAAAPCSHAEECPMPGRRNTGWCHFTFPSSGAPQWLDKLGRQAGMPKEKASLSFLLLTRGDACPVKFQAPPQVDAASGLVRIVSESFGLPGGAYGRYGCTDRGLILLRGKVKGTGPWPGELVRVKWPDRSEKDQKSGALIVDGLN